LLALGVKARSLAFLAVKFGSLFLFLGRRAPGHAWFFQLVARFPGFISGAAELISAGDCGGVGLQVGAAPRVYVRG
jgi:hypothetical protein